MTVTAGTFTSDGWLHLPTARGMLRLRTSAITGYADDGVGQVSVWTGEGLPFLADVTADELDDLIRQASFMQREREKS